MKILSISIALFNLGKLIEKNIESIINSKYLDYIDVLVIDDGSSDNSCEIVEEYEKKYPNSIRLIKKKNGGPGSTVNCGISFSRGKYFMMLDGDDWVDTDGLDNVIEKILNLDVDLVVTNYKIYNERKDCIEKIVLYKNIIENKILSFSEYASKLVLSMHSVIYKTCIFKDNNIVLDNGFYTDTEFVLFPTRYINLFYYINMSLYIYRVGRDGQSVNFKSLQKNYDYYNFILFELIKKYENEKKYFDNNKKKYFINRLIEMLFGEILIILSEKKNSKKRVFKLIKEIKNNSNEVYLEAKKNKKIKVIIFCRGLFIPFINIYYNITKKFI